MMFSSSSSSSPPLLRFYTLLVLFFSIVILNTGTSGSKADKPEPPKRWTAKLRDYSSALVGQNRYRLMCAKPFTGIYDLYQGRYGVPVFRADQGHGHSSHFHLHTNAFPSRHNPHYYAPRWLVNLSPRLVSGLQAAGSVYRVGYTLASDLGRQDDNQPVIEPVDWCNMTNTHAGQDGQWCVCDVDTDGRVYDICWKPSEAEKPDPVPLRNTTLAAASELGAWFGGIGLARAGSYVYSTIGVKVGSMLGPPGAVLRGIFGSFGGSVGSVKGSEFERESVKSGVENENVQQVLRATRDIAQQGLGKTQEFLQCETTQALLGKTMHIAQQGLESAKDGVHKVGDILQSESTHVVLEKAGSLAQQGVQLAQEGVLQFGQSVKNLLDDERTQKFAEQTVEEAGRLAQQGLTNAKEGVQKVGDILQSESTHVVLEKAGSLAQQGVQMAQEGALQFGHNVKNLLEDERTQKLAKQTVQEAGRLAQQGFEAAQSFFQFCSKSLYR